MADVTSGSTLNLVDLVPDWSYLFSAPLSSSQGITAVFLIILACVFFWAMGVFAYHLWRANRRISFITETLKDIKSDELVQKREQIKVDMDGPDGCKDLWLEFDESLVAPTDLEDQNIYNTIDAAHFFDTHSLARGMTESRLIAAIPGVLTAIGVLGTFMGLTLGLGGLGEIGGGTTQHLKEGISGMIHAASIAFTTSFWGVFSSVLFNIIEKLSESGIRRKIIALQDRIDHLFPRLTPEKMLMDISGYSKSSDKTMLHLAEKIGDRMQEAMLQMKNDISVGMANALQEVLAPALGNLAKSAEDMANKQTQSSEIAIEKVIHSFMGQFGQAGAKQGKMMRDSARDLQELIEKIKANQEQSMQRSNALDEKRQRALTDVFDAFKLVGEQNTQVAEGVVQQQKDVNQELIENIKANQEQSMQHSNALDEKRQRALTDAFDAFKLVGEQNTQTAEGVVQQQKNVTASVQKVSEDLLTFAEIIEDVSGQFSEAAKEIKAGNQELARTSQMMAGTVSDAARSNEQVSKSNQETNQNLQDLLDKIELSRASAEEISAQLRASAEAGKDTFAELNQHQEGYRNALNNHVKELGEQLSEIMEGYAKEVGDQTHNRLQAWDKETLNYTAAMQGVISAMENLVEEMDYQRTQ